MTAEVPEAVRENLALLTVPQVCELLNVKRDWLYDEARAGRIPHVKMGRAIRFRPAALYAWIQEKEKENSVA